MSKQYTPPSEAKCQNYNSKLKSFKILTLVLSFTLYVLSFAVFSKTANAIVDPLSVPNNSFGIHIIQAAPEESSPAAELVNKNGDWGYITVLIESNDRKKDKWQEFFNDLRRRHLIPLVRIATQPEQDFWKRPYEGEERAWADFLDNLNWPTKNRYVIIYNEPNHAKEWGNNVDAHSYSKALDQTITALKNKNGDFFVLNAGLDASAPSKPPNYEDQIIFMKQMNEAVPGIFEKLDGWVSHSYPNPAFRGLPSAIGRGTVRTYRWEIEQLKSLGVKKNLPIFITETGWKHAEGLNYDPGLPDVSTISRYYQQAFENAWNDSSIVAVTPFLLNYQESPFDHFSFKKPVGEIEKSKANLMLLDKVLAAEYPVYYPMYETLQSLPKTLGKPTQDKKVQLIGGEIYSSVVAGESYNINFTLKNIGQSIWNDREQINLLVLKGGKELGIVSVELPKDKKIEPGGEYVFPLTLKAPQSGSYTVSLNLFEGNTQFDSAPFEFTTEVKSPVVLKVVTDLKWKEDFGGNYILTIKGTSGENSQNIVLNKGGMSEDLEARYLLPDYTFEFTLEKPFYKSKTIKQKVYAGVNTLNFGTLQPALLTTLLNPKEFWNLTPFSN